MRASLADTRTCVVGATSVGAALSAGAFSTDTDSDEIPGALASLLFVIGTVVATAGSTLMGEDTIAAVSSVDSEITELILSLCEEASDKWAVFSIAGVSAAGACGATLASKIAILEGACP